MKSLILASSSPSRKAILDRTGYPFTVDVSDYEEDMTLKLPPRELAELLSQGKARAVAKRHTNAVIVGADSFGVFEGQFFGKPHTIERAKEMLAQMSGKSHVFVTGFTIIDADTGREHTGSTETTVHFKTLTPQAIADYLATDDVLRKAGAYDVNAHGMDLVERLDGDIDTVRGLPLAKVTRVLRDFGIDLV